jgi:hypothetical protein
MKGHRYSLTCLLLTAILLMAGCNNTTDTEQPQSVQFSGIHMLADAQMAVETPTSQQIKIETIVNMRNDGTESCKRISTTIDWPQELRPRLIEEQTGPRSSGSAPLSIGQQVQWGSDAIYNIEGLSLGGLQPLLENTPITIRCTEPEGYSNTVLPSVQMP